MDVKYTNCIKGFSILTVIWAHTGAKLDVSVLPRFELLIRTEPVMTTALF